MHPLIRIEEFYVADESASSIHCVLHITEPKTTRPEAGGYFIALMQLKNKSIEEIKQFQYIIEAISDEHYKDPTADFGDILKNINEQIGTNNTELPTDIDVFVGVLNNNTLSFAFRGNPILRLFYKEKHILTETNLCNMSSDERNSEQHFFSAMLEGPINPGDFLFLASEQTISHVPMKQIKHHLELYGSTETIKMIRRSLRPHAQDASFAGIVIHVPKVHIPTQVVEKNSADDSVLSLVNKTKSTEQTLSPSLLSHLIEKSKKSLQKITHKKSKKDTDDPDEPTQNNTSASQTIKEQSSYIQTHTPNIPPQESSFLVSSGKFIVQFFITFFKLLYTICYKTIFGIIGLFNFIVNRQNTRNAVLTFWQERPKRFVQSVKKLPLFSKILLSLIIISCTTFILSVVHIKYTANKEIAIDPTDEIVSQIKEKRDNADARVIYGEEDAALVLLHEAQTLVDSLPENNDEQKLQKKELTEAIAISVQELQHITVVLPEVLATLTEGTSQNAHVILAKDRLITYDQEKTVLTVININTKSTTPVSHETHPGLHLAGYNNINNTIYFLSQENNISAFDVEKNVINTRDISFPVESPTIAAGQIYNQRLYTFEQNNQQIYKHEKTQTGFGRGDAWLTGSNLALTNIVDMAIDSSVYLLNNTGIIRKFNRGSEEPFALDSIVPELTQANALVTSAEHDKIYILDSTEKRILVFDKTGGLIEQFTAKEWQNPLDIAVDANTNTIYLLDGNTVYSFRE